MSGDDVATVLERHFGRILAVQFHDSMATGIGEVVWEAKLATDDVVTGTIRIHVAVSRDEVVSWAELSFDAR